MYKASYGEEYTIEDAKELNITCGEHGITMTGVISDIDFSWHMYIHDFMYKVWMELTSVNNLNVKRVDAMIVEVQAEENYRVVHNGGLFAVNCDLSEITEEINAGSGCAYLSGIYSSEPNATGVSLITYVPMKFRSDYHITNSDVRVKTVFSTDVPSSYESKSVKSESTCVFCNMPLTTAVDEFWKYCYKPSGYEFEKPIGWSSWDYYYTSVTMEDMIENMDEIENDEILCDRIEYIAVDDGWEHREGDWYACYRFPDGIENLAKEVKARGYKPGIWTAPNNLQVLCGTVQRNNSFLIRDEIGDPIKIGDMYILDPTHPDGIEFLRELYTRLRGYG
ncbi:MAG: hypothetical protein GX633_03280, partial [Clostridiales bacterium]|nr:hypothetical protein [Clostridiales bacterium]